MRVADAVVKIFKTEGVKFVATLPGDDILPLFDVLHQNAEVPLILTRHEQASVYMAEGYARSTGEVGVARTLGAYGEQVTQPKDLQPALRRALAHPGPALLEVAVKPLEPRPWRSESGV
ncbi:MAG: thiamine pyrophosphate-binding protein [Deltaproteobacteria bacterium]|nr:thiamine pyrophosphate-binding protein [Deltaproteobacteria bacterium]